MTIERIGVPHVLVQHDKQPAQRATFGLSGESLAGRIKAVQEAASTR